MRFTSFVAVILVTAWSDKALLGKRATRLSVEEAVPRNKSSHSKLLVQKLPTFVIYAVIGTPHSSSRLKREAGGYGCFTASRYCMVADDTGYQILCLFNSLEDTLESLLQAAQTVDRYRGGC